MPPLRVAVELSELCVLCLCLLQDGDVRIGILPKNQEVLISSAGLGGVTGHRVRRTELEMGERADWFIQHNAPMVEGFWELGGCFLGLDAQQDRLLRAHKRGTDSANYKSYMPASQAHKERRP